MKLLNVMKIFLNRPTAPLRLSYSFTISCVKVYSILFASSILFPLILEKERKNSKKVHKQALAHLWTSFFVCNRFKFSFSAYLSTLCVPFKIQLKKALKNQGFCMEMRGIEPLSENPSIRTSPITVSLFPFPRCNAD